MELNKRDLIDPIELSQRLIRCPSVTPIEGGALDELQAVLERIGFKCTRLVFSESGTPDVDNLYARIGEDGPNFCFICFAVYWHTKVCSKKKFSA